jgi:glycosyltransferase involved in cell wall biosynthesis
MRVKIAYVSCVGHIEDSHSARYFAALQQAGSDIIAIMPGAAAAVAPEGVRHIALPQPQDHFWYDQSSLRLLSAIAQRVSNSARLARHLWRVRPDACFCMEPDGWLIAVVLKPLLGHRVVADIREVFEDRAQAFPYRLQRVVRWIIRASMAWLSRHTDQIMHVSEHRQRAYDYLAAPGVVINGAYPELAAFPTTRRVGGEGGRGCVTAVHAGALRSTYASEELLRGLALARERFPALRLLVLGGIAGELNGVQDLLAELTRTGGLELRPQLPYDVVLDELLESDIGVNIISPVGQTHQLAQPRKLYEYLAAGLPVIATDVPSLREIVQQSDCGLVVDSTRPEQIADALVDLAGDAARRRELGINARRAAETAFNWEREVHKLTRLMERLGEVECVAAPAGEPG